MAFRYKDGLIDKLTAAGYNSNQLRVRKLIGQADITAIRHCETVNKLSVVGQVMMLTGLGLEDVIEYYQSDDIPERIVLRPGILEELKEAGLELDKKDVALLTTKDPIPYTDAKQLIDIAASVLNKQPAEIVFYTKAYEV